ncbi:MAG: SEC-C domain-containing protein [Pseudonocardiaceae bacterium]
MRIHSGKHLRREVPAFDKVGYSALMTAETELLADVETVAGLLLGDKPLDDDQIQFLLDALATASEDALGSFADRIECHTARGAAAEPQLTALRSQARRKEARAAVAFLAARAAEGAGDSESARRLIDEVLTHRPGLEPALHDGAEYAAARGDYPTADRYLRRAQHPSPLRAGLSEALAVTAGNVPRNDQCPCGSGRKFKVCCLREGAPPLAARAQLVCALLGTYAQRAPGLASSTPPSGQTEDTPLGEMFCLDLALFPGSLVDKFLAARGHWLRPDERELIEIWRQVPPALYEVLDVQRGTGVTVRALPDGEPIQLADEPFSQSAQRLELFCGRVVDDPAGPRMATRPVPIPRHRRRALADLLASDPSIEQLANFFAPEPPVQIRNSDGDDVHDCRVTYRVPHAQHAFDQLTQRLTQTGDEVVAWQRAVPDGRVLHLGAIRRDGDDFTVTANSPARIGELEAILRDVAPDAAEGDRRAERRSPEPDGREARSVILESYYLTPEPATSTPGSAATAAERLSRETEAGWLDTPGVIGDLTPREAATSTDSAILAELRSMIDDVEATRLQAQRAGQSTAGLMDAQRLREHLRVQIDLVAD